ncbi:SpoIIE family protein phosphatase [Gloeocapsa sp. PCC 73106]|uniref:SpoIIE family protein phosphatase n=1 Tax=Gloeocapsa sp. PCC 73106 TaxID=102232 RepID=UPI0002AC3154|nr:SpoIIE family protein phosphatase [Gloeocapsa sp. PCC 73106]ELR98478.1 serine phosphatase RsbU, regulator of sigma subunit [Gloeocapsa sp. PCC 73106]
MIKILIIDDDPTIQIILRRILAPEGYQILVASSGTEGVEIAHEHRPALIICDWIMPGMTGLDVCSKIKLNPKLSATFFILLTSIESTEENKVIGLDAGCDDFLCKSVMRKHHELKARVRSGLRVYYLHQELQREKQHLEAELEEAAEYVSSILPEPLNLETAKINTRFIPSRQLGGDSFDYYWLDPENLAIYLLDVSGHGLKAAFPSLSILNLLRSRSLNKVDFYHPREVLAGLNKTFPMTQRNQQYFTIWYGVYNLRKNRLTYSSAGHPPAILIYTNHQGLIQEKRLTTQGFAIGFFPSAEYREEICYISAQSKLYIFSDGIYEIEQSQGVLWGLEEFILTLKNHYNSQQNLDELLEEVRLINAKDDFADDLSIIQIDFI